MKSQTLVPTVPAAAIAEPIRPRASLGSSDNRFRSHIPDLIQQHVDAIPVPSSRLQRAIRLDQQFVHNLIGGNVSGG